MSTDPTKNEGIVVLKKKPWYWQVWWDRSKAERVKNAVANTAHIDGEAETVGELLDRHLLPAVEDLERRYRNGTPFPDTPLRPGPGRGTHRRKATHAPEPSPPTAP